MAPSRREYQKEGLFSYTPLVNQHAGHLVMAGLAEIQGGGYFIDILHVFTLVMTEMCGAFVLSARREGARKASREEQWMKITLWGKTTGFSVLRRRIFLFSF